MYARKEASSAMWWLCILIPLLLSGCGRSDALVTIRGTVTFDGEPVQDGSISLMPVDGADITGGGMVRNGSFTAESSPGEMAVQLYGHRTVQKDNPTQEEIERGLATDRVEYLPVEYNQQSKLRIVVSPSDRRFDFELNSQGDIPSGMGAP